MRITDMKDYMNLAFASRFGLGLAVATLLSVIFGG